METSTQSETKRSDSINGHERVTKQDGNKALERVIWSDRIKTTERVTDYDRTIMYERATRATKTNSGSETMDHEKAIEAASRGHDNWLNKQIADAKRRIKNMPSVMQRREGVIAKEGLYPGVEL